MKYPSLKNIALIVLAIALIGGAFFVAEYRNRQAESSVYIAPVVSTSTPQISPELQYQDTDVDGLKDWEEVILGTNPRNSDTDGDGTTDSREAELGRNPLVKGPNDKAESASASKTVKGEELAPIDLAARNFFARYMELRQAGISGDKLSQEELAEQVLRSGIVLQTPKVYGTAEIKIKQDDTIAAIKKYGNDVGTVFTTNAITSRNEVVIAKESLEKEDSEILKEIDPIIASYKNILGGLLKIEAPRSISAMHLNLVNSMSSLLFTAESFRKSGSDPLQGIQGTAQTLAGSQGLFNTFRSIKGHLESLGITYTSEQGGRFFIQTQ